MLLPNYLMKKIQYLISFKFLTKPIYKTAIGYNIRPMPLVCIKSIYKTVCNKIFFSHCA